MSLYKKYELGDVIRDDGVKSFQARDLTSGRQVQVHLVMGIPGRLPPPYELLDQLKKLPESHRAHVIETGEQSGTPYVVTLPLEGFSGFRDWLTEKTGTLRTAVPPKENREGSPLSRVGRWKIPALSDAAPAAPPAPPPAADRTLSLTTPAPQQSPAPQNPSLETTRIFTPAFPSAAPQAKAPAPEPPPPQPAAPVAPPPVPVPQPEPSEFTRAFLTPTLPATPAQSTPSAGEFTIAFGGSSAAPSHQPPPSPPPVPTEFTQAFFQPAVPAASQPEPSGISSQFGVPTIAPQPPKEPSEFTQAFSTFPPAGPIASQPEPYGITSQFGAPRVPDQQPKEPSEFTQAFSTFPPAGPIASQPEPSGFTSQFGTPKFAPQPATKDPGEFSQLFSSPLAQKQPPSQAPPVGEQTRLFESPASSGESTLRMNPTIRPEPQGLGLPKAPAPGFGSNAPQPQSSHAAPPPVSPEFASAPPPLPGSSPLMATRSFEVSSGPGRGTSQPASDDEYARRFGAPPAEPLTGNVPAPAPPAPKKKPVWPLIVLGVLIVLILIGLIITLLR